MKYYYKVLSFLLVLFIYSCGVTNQETKDVKNKTNSASSSTIFSEEDRKSDIPPSKSIDLKNIGIGPITKISIPDTIDVDLATKGEKIHNEKCMMCHKPYKRMIGPAPVNILERRTPEWVMNMIVDPLGMIQKDTLANALFDEFHGAAMPNQNISIEEARAILEYYRTL